MPGGTAANIAANASIVAKNNARLEFEELRTVDIVDETGEAAKVVVGRLAEVRFIDVNTGIVLSTHNVPYGSTLYVADGEVVEKGKLIAKWDPFNAVIIPKLPVRLKFEGVIENVTYKIESDEATGLREIIIIESKDKTKVPSAHILTEDGDLIRTYNLHFTGLRCNDDFAITAFHFTHSNLSIDFGYDGRIRRVTCFKRSYGCTGIHRE